MGKFLFGSIIPSDTLNRHNAENNRPPAYIAEELMKATARKIKTFYDIEPEIERIKERDLRSISKSIIKKLDAYGRGLTDPLPVLNEYNKFIDHIEEITVIDESLQETINQFCSNHLVKFLIDYHEPERYIVKAKSHKPYESPLCDIDDELTRIIETVSLKSGVINGCISLTLRNGGEVTEEFINSMHKMTVSELCELSKRLFWRDEEKQESQLS